MMLGDQADKGRSFGITCGAWLSLVERCVRDAEAAGSNPVAPSWLDMRPFSEKTERLSLCQTKTYVT